MARVLADIDKVSLAGWRRAVKKAGVNIDRYVTEDWREDDELPWGVVETG
jgi:hypothetical protein